MAGVPTFKCQLIIKQTSFALCVITFKKTPSYCHHHHRHRRHHCRRRFCYRRQDCLASSLAVRQMDRARGTSRQARVRRCQTLLPKDRLLNGVIASPPRIHDAAKGSQAIPRSQR